MLKKAEVRSALYEMIIAFEKKDSENYPHMAIGALITILSDALIRLPKYEQDIFMKAVDQMAEEALKETP